MALSREDRLLVYRGLVAAAKQYRIDGEIVKADAALKSARLFYRAKWWRKLQEQA